MYEELQGSVDRRVPDVRVLGAHRLVDLIAGNVTPGLEEDVQDQIPLPGLLQIVLIEVAGQGLALDFVGHSGNLSEPADTTNARRTGPGPGALLGA